MNFDIINLKETESTNTYAKALLNKGEPCAPFTLVYTENQTKGRGRMGREWLSTQGDTLCMSLIAPYPFCPAITLISAVGVYRALKNLTDTDIKIKWPNDLIHGSKKICGILTESTDKSAVIGVGINLNTEEFPEEIAHKATSLKLITGNTYNHESVAKSVAQSIIRALLETEGKLSENVLKEYTHLCANIGRNISFGENSGVAVGVASDGCLIAKTPQGTKKINSGEVIVSGIY